MNNFSESNKKLISELVTDLEMSLIDNKKQCHSAPINKDIEKEINEIIEVLIERSNVGVGRGEGTLGSKKRQGSLGGGGGYSSGGGSGGGYGSSRAGRSDRGSGYTGAMVTVSGGKKYLGDPSLGLSPSGFWHNIRNDLQTYVNTHYREIELRTANLGVTRDLDAASNPNSDARVAGSKHGAGLATDVYLHVKDHPYTEFRRDNARLVQDKKLVRTMRAFAETLKPGVVWGGNFGGGTGDHVAPRGILEFHHFEIADDKMPEYFARFRSEIEALDGDLTVSDLTSTRNLGTLYSKIS